MVIDLFSDFDFKVLEQPGFKEDAVREELITPILHKLGYRAFGSNKIIRSKRLEHPFVSVGSTQRKISITPDYMLLIDNRPVLVLDAKSPIEEISSGPAREQAYFYAIHPEIRTRLYALCNGREFIVFHVEKDAPILYFHVSTITRHWDKLYNLLSPDAFNPQSEFKPKLPSPVKQKTFLQLPQCHPQTLRWTLFGICFNVND